MLSLTGLYILSPEDMPAGFRSVQTVELLVCHVLQMLHSGAGSAIPPFKTLGMGLSAGNPCRVDRSNLTCPNCGRPFKRLGTLHKHWYRKHGDSSAHPCAVCSKSYALREDLLSHCRRLGHYALVTGGQNDIAESVVQEIGSPDLLGSPDLMSEQFDSVFPENPAPSFL